MGLCWPSSVPVTFYKASRTERLRTAFVQSHVWVRNPCRVLLICSHLKKNSALIESKKK